MRRTDGEESQRFIVDAGGKNPGYDAPEGFTDDLITALKKRTEHQARFERNVGFFVTMMEDRSETKEDRYCTGKTRSVLGMDTNTTTTARS